MDSWPTGPRKMQPYIGIPRQTDETPDEHGARQMNTLSDADGQHLAAETRHMTLSTKKEIFSFELPSCHSSEQLFESNGKQREPWGGKKKEAPAWNRTRITGIRIRCDNRYTTKASNRHVRRN